MPDRNDTRFDPCKLLPRVWRAERRHEPEPVPVLDVVEERLAVVHQGAIVLVARREGADAAQVLGRLGVRPCDCEIQGG